MCSWPHNAFCVKKEYGATKDPFTEVKGLENFEIVSLNILLTEPALDCGFACVNKYDYVVVKCLRHSSFK